MADVVTSAFSPTSDRLLRTNPVSFDVTSDGALSTIIVTAQFGSDPAEVAFDGADFDAKYAGRSSRTAISNVPSSGYNGFRFVLMRDGGWPSAPTFRVFRSDSGGSLSDDTPTPVTLVPDQGVSALASRSDHAHAHGFIAASTNPAETHGAADATNYGFLSPTHYTLLETINTERSGFLRADGTVHFTNNQDADGWQITNLSDAGSDTEADTYGQRLEADRRKSAKAPVVVCTVAELASYVGTATTLTASVNSVFPDQDGVNVAGLGASTTTRVLVASETGANAKYNGLYYLSTVGSVGTKWVLTRTEDAFDVNRLYAGCHVHVVGGDTMAGHTVTLLTDVVTMGTTAQYWRDVSGALRVLRPSRTDFPLRVNALCNTMVCLPTGSFVEGDDQTVTLPSDSPIGFSCAITDVDGNGATWGLLFATEGGELILVGGGISTLLIEAVASAILVHVASGSWSLIAGAGLPTA